jgi:4-hydroxybenzoate polyprenyltransferase
MNVQIAHSDTMQTLATPLVVDVDGTLVATDLLHEAVLQFVARHPFQIFRILGWLLGGKSNLKTQLADRVSPGIETVPLRQEVLSLIRAAQAQGRPVYLASASDHRYVDSLAERIGGIAGCFATDTEANLAGQVKADRLVVAFGENGYDYIGDRPIDFTVWHSARKPLVVARNASFAKKVLKTFSDAEIIARPNYSLRSYVRALRVHQWAKNVLLFLPIIAGHRFDLETVAATFLGFFCFCFAASSAYLINDLLDLPGDRDHPRKARRPFASGQIPITHGVILATLLMGAALGLSMLLPTRFVGILFVYVTCTLGYSLLLKRKVMIDVITLGGLYTLRVYGGLAAINAHQTQWLLMFSLFLFLSLAIVKRCSEIVDKRAAGKAGLMGRGYQVEDLSALLPLGAAAGYGSVLVVALYMSSPEMATLYSHPNRLWLICPLLAYWISRVIILANRGVLHDDPVIFALKDRVSWATGICAAGIIGLSI